MKTLQTYLLRAVCAAIAGYLLVMYRTEMVHWMTIAFGAMFLVSGLVSVIVYYMEKRRAYAGDEPKTVMIPTFPIVGLGSMILGGVLMLMPASFITGVMYALAAILILGAISQFVNMVRILRYARIPFFFWLFPTVVLLVGLFLIARPQEMSALPFRLLGWSLMVYAIFEVVCGIKIYQARRRYEQEQLALEQKEEPEYVQVEEASPAE